MSEQPPCSCDFCSADRESAAWEAGMRHALAWLGLKQYGDVMAKDNPHRRAGE